MLSLNYQEYSYSYHLITTSQRWRSLQWSLPAWHLLMFRQRLLLCSICIILMISLKLYWMLSGGGDGLFCCGATLEYQRTALDQSVAFKLKWDEIFGETLDRHGDGNIRSSKYSEMQQGFKICVSLKYTEIIGGRIQRPTVIQPQPQSYSSAVVMRHPRSCRLCRW